MAVTNTQEEDTLSIEIDTSSFSLTACLCLSSVLSSLQWRLQSVPRQQQNLREGASPSPRVVRRHSRPHSSPLQQP